MASQFKKYLEKMVITALTVVLLSTSLVSWGIIIRKKFDINNDVVVSEAKEKSRQIKRGVVIFTGTLLVVAEYFHLNEED